MSTRSTKKEFVKYNSSGGEGKGSRIFSRDSMVTEFLELCIQPKTVQEMESVLLKFWERFESLSVRGNFSEIDVVCMFVLNYVYETRSTSVTSMSRSLFAYQRHVQVKFFENPSINPSIDCFLKELRDFSNLYTYSKRDVMLVDVGLGSILDASFGLTLFLVKFGLMEFPVDDITKGKKMVEMLVHGFNGYIGGEEGMRTVIILDDLLYRMRRSDMSFRRSLMILCTIVIVAEYEMHEKIEARFNLPSITEKMKGECVRRIKCLDLVVSSTTETKIIFRDIENFIAKILCVILHGSVCRRIVDTSRKLFCDVHEFHNPRSLKDLARCNIRSRLLKRKMFSEQVNQLAMPDALKDYLLFQTEGHWDLLKENHLFHSLHKKVNDSLFLIGNIVVL